MHFTFLFFLFTWGSILNCSLAKKPADFHITPATSQISVGTCLYTSKAETRLDMATLLLGWRSVRGKIGFSLYPGVGFLTQTKSVHTFTDYPIIRVLVPNRLWLKDLSCWLDKSFLLCGFPLFFFLFTCGSILNCSLAKKPADFYTAPATSNISGGICLNASKAETRLDMATLLLGWRSVRGTIGFSLYPSVGFLTQTRSVHAFIDHPIIRVLVQYRL